ncbi:MAG: coproporphyrinogen dehydrogenase HemZ [Clostridia bacterium]|nr:coproporphyrinogen dehydrogenase HemZ [Clostridia bacterium]
MTELQAALETIHPELLAMTRLFGLPDAFWDPPARYVLRAEELSGSYRITFGFDQLSAERTLPVPSEADPRVQHLHRRRAARRLCKQTLYDLCRKMTGIHPPWGSLTGVRPTHLMLEALGEGLSPEAAVERLVRDYDVTLPKAQLLAEIAAVQRLLPAPDDAFMDVYIGIPFCTTRCAYCSFSSGEIGDGRLVPPYMDALEHEIRSCASLIAESGRSLRALYVGGGTPTALPEKDFRRLLSLIRECFPSACETTVEAGRPDTLTREKLRAIREAEISRISINPQTMNDRTLQIIGRAHTARQVVEAYALAREEGLPHINMDVIAGLPGEGEAEFTHTMEEALRLHPESLTVHTLAIKRSSRMSLENAPLPDGEMTARMVSLGLETARTLGMVPYYLYRQKYMAGNLENTGYALPGHACLYNVDMMEETSHILALGAGGISKRIWPDEGHITRAPNVANIREYILRVDEMIRCKKDLFLQAADPEK